MLAIKRIFPLGDQVILIEFDTEITPIELQKLMYIKSILHSFFNDQKVEILHTYNTISIRFLHHYNFDINAQIQNIKNYISSITLSKDVNEISFKVHKIPVCYEAEMALDLELLSAELGMQKEEIIELHTQPNYTIYFHGFLPGFLYLGGLPTALHFPRKPTPRLKIPCGSVGIGGSQTGVYPSESPGGWQIIGRCPIQWFNVNKNPPSPFEAGEQIQFYPISKKVYFSIKEKVKLGTYQHQIVQND